MVSNPGRRLPTQETVGAAAAHADGGCLLVGYTFSQGCDNADILAINTDSLGDTIWSRTYGGPGRDYALAVLPVEDGFVAFVAMNPETGTTTQGETIEEAIANLDKKVAANPENLIAWVFLAYMHSRLGHKRRAKKAADQVQRVNPLFSVEEFSQTLKFQGEDGRVRFPE